MAYYLFQDTQKLWRWRLRAANGRIIADSGEAYYNRADALAGINLVKGSNSAPIRDA